MAKKQTRRSISVSRTTYEKLKAFCETNGISMSQFVENRVGDFLGEPPLAEHGHGQGEPAPARPAAVAPLRPVSSAPGRPPAATVSTLTTSGTAGPARPSAQPGSSSSTLAAAGHPAPPARPAPMTSAAARYAVEPPLPIIKRAEQPAPKAPAMPKANEIFTF